MRALDHKGHRRPNQTSHSQQDPPLYVLKISDRRFFFLQLHLFWLQSSSPIQKKSDRKLGNHPNKTKKQRRRTEVGSTARLSAVSRARVAFSA
jgi:hypothetical protein